MAEALNKDKLTSAKERTAQDVLKARALEKSTEHQLRGALSYQEDEALKTCSVEELEAELTRRGLKL